MREGLSTWRLWRWSQAAPDWLCCADKVQQSNVSHRWYLVRSDAADNIWEGWWDIIVIHGLLQVRTKMQQHSFLIPTFQDNLYKPVSECQTVIDFAAQSPPHSNPRQSSAPDWWFLFFISNCWQLCCLSITFCVDVVINGKGKASSLDIVPLTVLNSGALQPRKWQMTGNDCSTAAHAVATLS